MTEPVIFAIIANACQSPDTGALTSYTTEMSIDSNWVTSMLNSDVFIQNLASFQKEAELAEKMSFSKKFDDWRRGNRTKGEERLQEMVATIDRDLMRANAPSTSGSTARIHAYANRRPLPVRLPPPQHA